MYASDLTDDQWRIIKPFFPNSGYQHVKAERPREWTYLYIIGAIFYVNKTDCQWRLILSDFLPWGTVYTYFRHWRIDGTWQKIHDTLRDKVRIQEGKNLSQRMLQLIPRA